MAGPGRPRKNPETLVKLTDSPDVLKRLRIFKDYEVFIVIMDISDVVPFASFRSVDAIFAKIGLIIKRQFGYLGFTWGYGAMNETRHPDAMATVDAPVSLHIYFQH